MYRCKYTSPMDPYGLCGLHRWVRCSGAGRRGKKSCLKLPLMASWKKTKTPWWHLVATMVVGSNYPKNHGIPRQVVWRFQNPAFKTYMGLMILIQTTMNHQVAGCCKSGCKVSGLEISAFKWKVMIQLFRGKTRSPKDGDYEVPMGSLGPDIVAYIYPWKKISQIEVKNTIHGSYTQNCKKTYYQTKGNKSPNVPTRLRGFLMCHVKKRMPWHGHQNGTLHTSKPAQTRWRWRWQMDGSVSLVELNTSWWLNQPIWKHMLVKLDHLPADSGENKEYSRMFETSRVTTTMSFVF